MASISSAATTQCVDIKRFSGDCERVTELLSEHDRTKNRKQYQVTSKNQTRGSSAAEVSLSEMSEVMEMCPEASTPADEYFNSAGIVESFVNELLEQAADLCDRDEQEHVEASSEPLRASAKHRRVRKNPTSGNKTMQRDSTKRHSSTSKTSSDSNRSHRSHPKAIVGDHVTDSMSGDGSDGEPLDERNNFDSVDSGVVVMTNGESTKSSATNTETTKKETAHQISWRKTQQTVEASIKNAEILRQNAERDSNFIRQNNMSLTDRKRHFDRLHPFHTHMLLYFGVYDTKQVLYSFQTLRNIIACDCRTFLCFSMTTSVPTTPVRQLLVR